MVEEKINIDKKLEKKMAIKKCTADHHNFEPRYTSKYPEYVTSALHEAAKWNMASQAAKAFESFSNERNMENYTVYVGDVCTHCGEWTRPE